MSRQQTMKLSSVAAVAGLLLVTACGSSTTDPAFTFTPLPVPSDVPPSAPDTIVYKVFGAPRASTITTDSNNQEAQDNQVSLPWRKQITLDGTETLPVYGVIAQNAGSGSITCQILFDGEVVATQTSTGPYAVVTCSYTQQ